MDEPALRDLLTVHDRVSAEGDWITPLRGALEGVNAAEAAWKPSSDERSIWEIVHHVVAWTDWATHFLRGADTDVTDWPPVTETGEDAWKATLARLDASLAALREQIAAMESGALFAAPVPEVTPTDRFLGVSSILVHNAYHAGQITKLRERRAAQPSVRADPAADKSGMPSLLAQIDAAVAGAQGRDAAALAAVRLIAERLPYYHWVGIYRLEGDTLVLGPYVGAATDHTRIPVGRGVCGTAVAEGKNQVIRDVRTLDNYLACSLETRSEIVVLIREPGTNRILGQIDADGHAVGAFDAADEAFLERVAARLAPLWGGGDGG